jgi:hypothetical protein
MSGKAIIVLGHSHVIALVEALAKRKSRRESNDEAHFFVHDVWKYQTQYAQSNDKGGVTFNGAVLRAIDRVVPPSYERQYVSVLGGNGHILLSLSRHPRPFDVVLPEQPDLPLEAGAEVLPFSYLAKTLLPFMLPYVWQLLSLRQAVGVRIYHLEPPPPCGDDDYMKTHLGSYIPDPSNIISRYLRLKMWRLHSQLLADICTKNDIAFLAAPKEGMDAEGFLKGEGYGGDATHANSWYGELLVNQLEHAIGGRYASFEQFTEGD